MSIPTDKEVIAILRARLTTVEEAAEGFLAVLEKTGNERAEAWDALNVAPDVFPKQVAFARFYEVYERTFAPRKAAIEALIAALTTDFKTALLQCDDLTEAQLAEWFTKLDPHDAAVPA